MASGRSNPARSSPAPPGAAVRTSEEPLAMPSWEPLTARMEGELVVVEPLAAEHEEGLLAAGHERELWTYLPG